MIIIPKPHEPQVGTTLKLLNVNSLLNRFLRQYTSTAIPIMDKYKNSILVQIDYTLQRQHKKETSIILNIKHGFINTGSTPMSHQRRRGWPLKLTDPIFIEFIAVLYRTTAWTNKMKRIINTSLYSLCFDSFYSHWAIFHGRWRTVWTNLSHFIELQQELRPLIFR